MRASQKNKRKKKQQKIVAKVLSFFNVKLEKEVSLRFIPFVGFVFLLFFALISLTHSANNKRIEISKLEEEIKEIRWEHAILQKEKIERLKYSEVIEKVSSQGLTYSNETVQIIQP